MEPINIPICAQSREFVDFLNDYLLILSKDSLNKLRLMGSERENTFHHILMGTLINYKITILDSKNLSVEISVSSNANDDHKLFVEEVVKQIYEKFPPADLPFGFKSLITDEEYSQLMEERWRESWRAQKAQAHLSTIILLGGILEGVLYCKILKNPREAIKSDCAPEDDKTGDKIPIDKWMLETMINVCHDRGWIDSDISKFAHAVQQYRNLVHPNQQLKSKLETPTEATCNTARTVIDGTLKNLLRNS